jgi:hypothetical protein
MTDPLREANSFISGSGVPSLGGVDIATPEAVRRVKVLLSCASDVTAYRRIARDVLERINQMFTYDHPRPIQTIEWMYVRDTPRLTRRNNTADRSRQVVGQSDVIAVILGARLGPTTKQEVDEAMRLRGAGQQKEVMLFRWKDRSDAAYADLKRDVLDRLSGPSHPAYNEEPLWSPFESRLDFQGLFFTSMTSYLLNALTPTYTVRN